VQHLTVDVPRQSVAIATSEREADDQAFVDAISVALDADDEQPPPE
jgi:hypothetical protein